jgi:hypothetical protein
MSYSQRCHFLTLWSLPRFVPTIKKALSQPGHFLIEKRNDLHPLEGARHECFVYERVVEFEKLPGFAGRFSFDWFDIEVLLVDFLIKNILIL